MIFLTINLPIMTLKNMRFYESQQFLLIFINFFLFLLYCANRAAKFIYDLFFLN